MLTNPVLAKSLSCSAIASIIFFSAVSRRAALVAALASGSVVNESGSSRASVRRILTTWVLCLFFSGAQVTYAETERPALNLAQAPAATKLAAKAKIDLPTQAAFLPAYTVAEAIRQHKRLPRDDIWWSVVGEDMAWNFKNLHQIMPTVTVYRGGQVKPLHENPMAAVADFPVAVNGATLTFAEFLRSPAATAMGVIVLHKGQIVFEDYPRMQPHEKPVYWSVAKAVVGTIVRLLEEQGQVDVSQPIEAYIPALNGSALAGINVRDWLDMASGLDCADEYDDRTSCYYRYSMSIGDGYREADAADNPYAFAAALRDVRVSKPGQKFSYSGLNTFVLAWLVETITGEPFQDTFSRLIWRKIGAEADASYIAPRYGIAVTHGGFLAQLRDVARLGLLFTPSAGVVDSEGIISDAHIRFLQNAGRPELRTNVGMQGVAKSGIKHNIYQWDAVLADGTLFKGGWAGQGLIVSPGRDVVMVYTGYFKDEAHSEVSLEPTLFAMLQTLFPLQ